MVVSSFNLAGNESSPYVTDTELLASPTASAIDFSNLIPNGGPAAQQRARAELIVRASAMVDTYLFGDTGTLGATVNVEGGRHRVNRLGQFIIHPKYFPIMEVRSFKAGYLPAGLTDIPVTNANCWIEPDQFIVSPVAGLTTSVGPLTLMGGVYGSGQTVYTQYTYVNGYANTFLATSANKGDTTLSVLNAIGVYPNQVLKIWDGMNDESVTVDAHYDGNSLTIPLVAPLTFAHGTGTNFSAIPATVKQATIHFVCSMVKD